jgi:hypothetical protein
VSDAALCKNIQIKSIEFNVVDSVKMSSLIDLVSSLISAIKDFDALMLSSPLQAHPVAIPLIWHCITTALMILPSQRDIPTPLPSDHCRIGGRDSSDRILYTPHSEKYYHHYSQANQINLEKHKDKIQHTSSECF